jgi:carboxymethylenebutenolidase
LGKHVDYYFTPVSPWTYLGHARFAALLAGHGATVQVKPVDYGRIFPASGGVPLRERAPQRQAYRLVELRRFRERLGVPLVLEPKFFPVDATPAALAILAVEATAGPAAAMRVAGACLQACWAEERDLADAATLAAIVRGQGLDPGPVLSADAVEDARRRLDTMTVEAIDRGVFGAPTYVLGGELFWGQDRLDFLAQALAR